MAAAGGFWAKGSFFAAAESAILTNIVFPSTGSQAALKEMVQGSGVSPLAMHKVVDDLLVDPESMFTAEIKSLLGEEGFAKAAAKAGGLTETPAKPQVVIDKAGVSFTDAEVQKLADANGLSYDAVLAKLESYKSAGWLAKWKSAAEGDGTLPKPAPKPKPEPEPVDTAAALAAQAASWKGTDFGDHKNTQATSWGMKMYADWSAGLTAAEKAGLQTYTTTVYKQISKVLRDEGFDASKYPHSQMTKVITGIDSALAKAKAPENVTLYRGANGAMWQGLKPGDSWTDKGFMSTSLSGSYAKKWADDHTFRGAPAIMEVHLKKGQTAAYLGKAGSAGAYEYEMLLPRNATYTVLKTSAITYKGKSMPYYVIEVEQHG
jgi:hypothetical protein